MTEDTIFEAMRRSILDYNREGAIELARRALSEGIEASRAIEQGFVPGIKLIGEKFGTGEIFLPELVQAAQAAKAALDVLQEHIPKDQQRIVGRYVIGTVKGDIHDIGKNLVGVMLSVNGWEVHDIGIDQPVDRFIDKAVEVNADVIGASALLTATIPQQKLLIETLVKRGLRDRFKVMVGGAAVESSWAREIGADGFGDSIHQAVNGAAKLIGA